MEIDQIVSMIVANGLWAALFCVLLAYELKDSRRRESRYNETIRSLSEKLNAVNAVKADTEELKMDARKILADTDEIKNKNRRVKKAEAVCA